MGQFKSVGTLNFEVPHFLNCSAQWTQANQALVFTKRAANIKDFFVLFTAQSNIGVPTQLNQMGTFFKGTLTGYQLIYNNCYYPQNAPVDCSTTDNMLAYIYLLRMLGQWFGDSGPPAICTQVASTFEDNGSGGATQFVPVVNLEEHGDQDIVSGLNNQVGNQDIIFQITSSAAPSTTYFADMYALITYVWSMSYDSSTGHVHLKYKF
jgi:hypothetical protein